MAVGLADTTRFSTPRICVTAIFISLQTDRRHPGASIASADSTTFAGAPDLPVGDPFAKSFAGVLPEIMAADCVSRSRHGCRGPDLSAVEMVAKAISASTLISTRCRPATGMRPMEMMRSRARSDAHGAERRRKAVEAIFKWYWISPCRHLRRASVSSSSMRRLWRSPKGTRRRCAVLRRPHAPSQPCRDSCARASRRLGMRALES